MSSSTLKRTSQTSCNVLLYTTFASSTSSLGSDSSSANTTRKSNSRITGGCCFKNCRRSIGGHEENSSSNSNASNSNKQYIRNNCRYANCVARKHHNEASVRFTNTPYGGACGGRRRFFILLPLALLFSLRHHLCTAGGRYEPEEAASPASSSSSSHHEWRIFSRRVRKRSTESPLSASSGEPTAASLSPTCLQEGEYFHELSSPASESDSYDRGRPSLQRRRKTSRARGSLRRGLLQRLNTRRKSKDLRKSYYSSDSDSMTPPIFDSPSIEKEFFPIVVDAAGEFFAATTGCTGESRPSRLDTSKGYVSKTDCSCTAPDTPTCSGGVRRQNTVAFQRLLATFSPLPGRPNGKTTNVFVEEGNEATTAKSRAEQQGEARDQEEKLQQKEQQQEQHCGAQQNLTHFSSTTPDAQVAIEPLPSLSRAGAEGKNTDSSSARVPPSTAAGSVVVKKRADLLHRLAFGAPQFPAHSPSGGDDFVRKTDETPHQSASCGPPQEPAEISAAKSKQIANSLGREAGDEDGLPVDPKKHDSHTALWETLHTAVADFHETTNLARFALFDIENACARQHRNIDEFVGIWVAKKALPKTTLSELSALVKDQERVFHLVQKADARCQQTQTALQRVRHLYEALKSSREYKRSIPQRGTETREAASPAHRSEDANVRKHAEAAARADAGERAVTESVAHVGDSVDPLSGAGRCTVARAATATTTVGDRLRAASEQSSVDVDSSEEFSLSSPTTSTAPICPSLACSQPNDIPQGGNNASFTSKNLCGMEEAEEEGALVGLGTAIHALQLEALFEASRCVAVKEEVAYTFIRLLYWLKIIRAPELHMALLKKAAASANEEALTSLGTKSRELLSPYIRRKACPPQAGQGLPERARKMVDLVNFAASAVWKIFEGVRQRQVHLDVWLAYLVRDIVKGKRVLAEIRRLKELQEEGRRETDNILSILQVQQISWSWSVALVERQLQEQPLAFKSACTCKSLWNAAKDIVTTKAELYYLIKASDGLNRKLASWEKYFLRAAERKSLRKRAT